MALARAEPIPEDRPAVPAPSALEGVDLAGRPARVELDGPTVVVFVSTACEGCVELADLVRDGVDGFCVAVLGVLRASLRRACSGRRVVTFCGPWRTLARSATPLAPYEALRVRSAPFFVRRGPRCVVVSEERGFARSHLVESHLDALAVRAGSPAPDLRRLDPDGA